MHPSSTTGARSQNDSQRSGPSASRAQPSRDLEWNIPVLAGGMIEGVLFAQHRRGTSRSPGFGALGIRPGGWEAQGRSLSGDRLGIPADVVRFTLRRCLEGESLRAVTLRIR